MTETVAPIEKLPSIHRLIELFSVRADGHLVRKTPVAGAKYPVGSVAGRINKSGYVEVGIDGMTVLAHRVVFAIAHGRWPSKMVDHINRNRADNRPSNLREATNTENQRNSRLRADNTSGVRCVTWDSSKQSWRVAMRVSGRKVHFGRYQELELAELVAAEVTRKHHGEFAYNSTGDDQ